MAPEYPYLSIAGNYFCAQCNVLSLLWIFLFKHKRLHLHAFGIRRRQLLHLLKAVRHFHQNNTEDIPNTLSLAVPGHLCIPVHYGHKVFDFSKLTATKIFSADVDPYLISDEINCVRDASTLPFTPALLEVDKNERWYTESFVPGNRSAKTSESSPRTLFKQTVCAYLAGIIESKDGQDAALGDYLADIQNDMRIKLTHSTFENNLRSYTNEFISRISDKLRRFDDARIRLAFTHGDFSFVNFIYGKNGITVIDWEGAKYRSILHDLYNYFLTELYYERVPSLDPTTFSDAIQLLGQRLAAGGGQRTETLADPNGVYRWLYYLERIQMLLDREQSSIQRDVVLKSIDTFHQFETAYHGAMTANNPNWTTE